MNGCETPEENQKNYSKLANEAKGLTVSPQAHLPLAEPRNFTTDCSRRFRTKMAFKWPFRLEYQNSYIMHLKFRSWGV